MAPVAPQREAAVHYGAVFGCSNAARASAEVAAVEVQGLVDFKQNMRMTLSQSSLRWPTARAEAVVTGINEDWP